MKRNGFTLVELLAVIVILGCIGSIAVISYNSYIKSSEKQSYTTAETTMKSGVESIYTYCSANGNVYSYCKELPNYNETERFTIEEIISAGFMDPVIDNGDKSKKCTGYVDVKNINSVSLKLEYKVCLKCSDYQSSDCK